MSDEKFTVNVQPLSDGTIPTEDELLEMAADAGWTGDPGEGRAILIPNERGTPAYEVFNSVPFGTPIGWEPTAPIEELIRERVKEEYARLKDDEEIDDIIDAEDFDIGDELPELSTIYEFMAMEEEAPAPKNVEVTRAERIKDELDYEELKDREKRLRQLRAREEYDRRLREHEDLYGPSERVREALARRGEEEGGR